MLELPIVIAPDPIFTKKAEPVTIVDDNIREIVKAMFATMYREQGAGIGANMVGVLKRIIVMDLKENGENLPIAMINPELLESSDEVQEFEEASLSFPGISAKIKRPSKITVSYLDPEGREQQMQAEGFLATVIQHEMDYLEGRTYLDHLSKLKRDTLIKKYRKMQKAVGG